MGLSDMNNKIDCKKIRCCINKCQYSTKYINLLKNHIIRHNPEEIYDFAFENSLLNDEIINPRSRVHPFLRIVDRISKVCK